MPKKDELSQVSDRIINMLVDSTLKKHGVALDGSQITSKEKNELRTLVQQLQNNLQSLHDQQQNQ